VQSDYSSENPPHLSQLALSKPTLSAPIILVGFLCGLFLSIGVLNGDESGRVNLLYLLMVYLFIPLVGAFLSVTSLINGRGINVARLISALPIWRQPQQTMLLRLRQQKLDKHWFFLQSQAAALAYAVASLISFFILLLATDMNFVWRSTILHAEQLYPVLKVIAAPWWFWDMAQPTTELLRATQDSRLINNYDNTANYGQWWAFILATQVVYSFALRGALLAISTALIRKTISKAANNMPSVPQGRVAAKNENHAIAALVHSLPVKYTLSNWAAFNKNTIEQLAISPSSVLTEGPSVALEDRDVALEDQNVAFEESTYDEQSLLVLVKSWEPPMGELHDFLHNQKGVIFPVNLMKNEVVPPESNHLKEWQRFAQSLPHWAIYLPETMDMKS